MGNYFKFGFYLPGNIMILNKQKKTPDPILVYLDPEQQPPVCLL